ERALACLELALEVDPEDPATFTAFLATCRDAHDPRRAARYIRQRIERDPRARRLWGRFRKFFGRRPAPTPSSEARPSPLQRSFSGDPPLQTAGPARSFPTPPVNVPRGRLPSPGREAPQP
ncbi:MAG: hypothetical protein AB1758_14830, partial [Candidatus Eremiobacterota bacterium]